MKQLLEKFPYSKEEFARICMAVDLLILDTCRNASLTYSDEQVSQIFKGYQTLKYPLLMIWEYYGFGEIDEIITPFTSKHLYQLYKSFDTLNSLEQTISGMSQQNPFDFYGKIEHSEEIVNKLLRIYRHLHHDLSTEHIPHIIENENDNLRNNEYSNNNTNEVDEIDNDFEEIPPKRYRDSWAHDFEEYNNDDIEFLFLDRRL